MREVKERRTQSHRRWRFFEFTEKELNIPSASCCKRSDDDHLFCLAHDGEIPRSVFLQHNEVMHTSPVFVRDLGYEVISLREARPHVFECRQ